MVGGSVWQLKIDTKRFQNKKDMFFEQESESIIPKKKQKDQDEAETKTRS